MMQKTTVSQRFEELWKSYPKRFGKDSACRDWISEVTQENESKVFSCLQRYLRSAEVAKGAVMNLGSTVRDTGWIVKCARDDWESEWPPANLPRGVEIIYNTIPLCGCGEPAEQRGMCKRHLAEFYAETQNGRLA